MESMKWPIVRSCGWNRDNDRYEHMKKVHILLLYLLNIERVTITDRQGRCKRRVGIQGGLQRTKPAIVTDLLGAIGRLGKRGSGNLALIYLANSQKILILIHDQPPIFSALSCVGNLEATLY